MPIQARDAKLKEGYNFSRLTGKLREDLIQIKSLAKNKMIKQARA